MNFIFILLPNLYDIFTLIMIGYAFFLNHNSQLQIPFITACLLIYATTRIGIFAGKIVNLMAGKTNSEEQNLEEPEDVVMKKMILGVIPQCLFVIICQVIFALCFLQNPAAAKYINTDNLKKNNAAEQMLPNLNEEQNTEAVNEEIQANNTEEGEEEIIPTITNQKAEVAPVSNNKPTRKAISQKKPKINSQPQETTNNVYYEIPDKTLRSAGISPAERRITYSQKTNAANASVIATNNSSDTWTFSSANSKVTRIAQNAIGNETPKAKQTTPNSLQPKRYPGDDNPINANWGYYKYTEQPVNRTQNNTTAPQQRNNIPEKTLRSIGY